MKQADNGSYQRQYDESNGYTVQDKHCFGCDSEIVEAFVDAFGPLQIREMDIAMARPVQLPLQHLLRVEVEQRSPIRAGRDVLVDVRSADRVIRHCARDKVSLAIVHEMHRVEVMESKVFGNARDSILDLGLDGIRNVIDEAEAHKHQRMLFKVRHATWVRTSRTDYQKTCSC